MVIVKERKRFLTMVVDEAELTVWELIKKLSEGGDITREQLEMDLTFILCRMKEAKMAIKSYQELDKDPVKK